MPPGRAPFWLAVLSALLPSVVWACPACSVKAPESPGRSLLLVVALVLTPVVLVGGGFWAVRRAAREDSDGASP